MLYFAYGSNLDWNQMRERCPSAKFVCMAKLADHALAFTRRSETRRCGVADAVPKRGAHVWGVVYQIEEIDMDRLDASEGYRPSRPRNTNSYVREEQTVHENGDQTAPLLAAVYFANKQNDPPLPSAEYKRLIVEGAKSWHLPEDYVSALESIQVSRD